MPNRIAATTLNASALDIINTIRANASYEYQSLVPEITTATEIPKVGEILFGYPALANQFINALVNRIASVRVKSANFNNPYAPLKKGFLEFGETVEEAFVSVAKAREFSVEKAPAREFKRTLPDVRTAFHAMNWRVQYPLTVQREDLKRAFLSEEGVNDLIEKIVQALYVANEYDEYLLFKYLIIKAVSSGKIAPVAVDTSDIKNAAVAFRGKSNMLTFMSSAYNASAVTTTTPKEDQYIFMDAMYNANYDVNILASAFNMDKADFMGRLSLIDRWDTFDNARFSEIIAGSDMVESVTAAELAIMSNVIAVIADKEWFQVYDNLAEFSETYVASGLYWNYFYNVWKTVSWSPFSNAVVFTSGSVTLPASVTYVIADKSVSDEGTVLTLEADPAAPAIVAGNARFVQTEDLTEAGIAVQPYGMITIPADQASTDIELVAVVDGTTYTATADISAASDVGDTVTLSK